MLYSCSTWAVAQIDLELRITAEPLEIKQWSSGAFKLVLENKGTIDATGVAVRLPLTPQEVVLVGSVQPQASAGTFRQSIWENIEVPAGEVATLRLQLYSKVPALELFAEVIAADQMDVDSTPDSGMLNEDDEAYYPHRVENNEDENDGDEEEENNTEGIDLELLMTTDTPDLEQWSAGKFVLILENKGANTATNIEVQFPLSASEVTIAGGASPIASSGVFQQPIWTIPELLAGDIATLEIELYSKVPALELFAEVIAADQADTDSAPANGECCRPNEDDEASLLSDLTLSNIEFPTQLERGEPLRFNLDVDNIGDATAAGDFIVGFYLSEDEELGEGDRSVSIIRTGDLTVGKHEATALINLPLDVLPGEYYLIIVADIDGTIQERNEVNNFFRQPVTVGAPGDVDLELTFSSPRSSVDAFVDLPLTLTIFNTSNSDATGVVVYFPLEAGKVVLAGGTTPSFSQGNYNYFNGMWYVRDLPAGQSATVQVQFFPIANDYVPFAQVIAADQADEDSTPENGVCCAAMEDDEAAFPANAIIGERVDIEVNLATKDSEVGRFSNLPVDVQVRNKGSVTATDIIVSFEACGSGSTRTFGRQSGIVYANRPSTASLGDYNKVQQLWRIDSLAPGQSALLDLQLYSLTQEQARIRAIAIRYEGDDVDSSPATFDFEACDALEDDEATLDINTQAALNEEEVGSWTSDIYHQQLKVFPNPTATTLEVQFRSTVPNVSYRIYDAQGKIHRLGNWKNEAGKQQYQLDISQLPTAWYVLHLKETQQAIRFFKLP
ncbi:MAG: CARDB domain-containing protein [Bacteroidota bacterium]